MEDLAQFRKEKDELFGKEDQSPLTTGQKQNFKGLNYYSLNQDLIFHGLEIEPVENELVQIKTSAGDTQPFKKLGKIKFEIGGALCELTVYDSTTDNAGVFLPFKDGTNISETYHDGRYIEIEVEAGKIKELDFNYAYNPYCAYNDGFRCPITPNENTLPVEIKAGEKKFD